MPEFHNYLEFVIAAYSFVGLSLLALAIFSWLQLKKNATILKEKQSQKKSKN